MFNANQILDSLLSAGKDLVNQGKDLAQEKMNLPEDKTERSAMMSGMSKGALATGVLAILLGTKAGRSVSGGALKVGSLAALGSIAYKAYQNWQNDNQEAASNVPAPQAPETLNEEQANEHSLKLLQAIIAAAKADGHIDAKEQATIDEFVGKMEESSELSQFVQNELNKPLDPAEVAAGISDVGLASEVYVMSRLIIDDNNAEEKAYLEQLAKALNLDEGLVAQLDAQAAQATA